MENISCLLCGPGKTRGLFSKESDLGESFMLRRCRNCGLEFISPRPDRNEIGRYYEDSYFSRRTDRGYNDYFSEPVKQEIERVFALNLRDLGFYEFEQSLQGEKRALDIGCAAGYFVSYLEKRAWDARGIDISRTCIDAGQSAGIAVEYGDYLKRDYAEKFDLITLWASIEHLHDPDMFIKKIRADLKEGGRVYISTCRAGGLNFMRLFGKDWRFYNFPEHLYFFSRKTMKELLRRNGLSIIEYRTYGSGFGNPGSFIRRTADRMAKNFYLGDMMLLAAAVNR